MQQLMAVGPTAFDWREAPAPRLLSATDAIVRPLAVSICDADALYMRGRLPVRDPFCFGHEFVAEIVSLGDEVTGFGVGDRVVVAFLIACGTCAACRRGLPTACTTVNGKAAFGFGIYGDWGGALSDLIRVPFASTMMALLPANVSPAAAASVGDNLSDGFRCVAEGLDEQPGAPVLVVAGGGGTPSVALYAAAMAVALGSEQVDYLDSNPSRLAIAEALGARPIESAAAPRRMGCYPVTVDASGDPSGAWLGAALRSTAPYGRCASCGVYLGDAPVPLGAMYDRGVRFTIGWNNPQAHMARVLELLAAAPDLLDPIHTIAPWSEAIDRLARPPTKLILARPEAL